MSDTTSAPSGWTEAERLAALRDYDILDTEPERAFDDIVDLIATLFDAPIAVVNLIDEGRQWFKAEKGLGVRETPLESSFCAHAILEADRMVVPDATQDTRFTCNPLVTDAPGLRFYAGQLLKSAEGLPLGTLCVLDTRARPEGPTELQLKALEVLADQVMTQLNLRRALKHQQRSEAEFRAIADSMPQMVWSTLPDGHHDYYNARWYEFTGVPPGSTDGEGWNDMFHPEDQERAWERWRHSLATGDPYEIEYRLRRHDGVYCWTLGRAMPVRDAEGRIVRWFGTCTDIDDLKRMDQAKELLSQELSHRIKNIFAVVSALVALSARQHPEARPFAQSLRTRINALARAHEFVRPHSDVSRPTMGDMTLHGFLAALFTPYTDEQGQPRVRITGDDAAFDDQAATSVALLFHELATNAAKYGALSVEGGYVDVETDHSQAGLYRLAWRERQGPAIDGVPQKSGFGSSLATLSVEGQLAGKLTRNWNPDGLEVLVELPATALSRRNAARVVTKA
ncbi:PAS domain-containing protein [Brevundimonas poindexterae]|uniref:PAS domain-containing protein n=1 Tax=Brevundimonas poindexterae TaxID=74325 RepID=UPI001CFD6507|nr:PAS domain-containing protein [Brevundimonas poindexterae]